jgi:hypothetical protein
MTNGGCKGRRKLEQMDYANGKKQGAKIEE